MRCTTASSSNCTAVGRRRHIASFKCGRLSIAESAHPASSGVSMAECKPLTILLVEDSAVLADRLTEILHRIPGVTLVDAVDSERAAIAITLAQSIDVM